MFRSGFVSKKGLSLISVILLCLINFIFSEAPVMKREEVSLLKKFILRNKAKIHEPVIRKIGKPFVKKYLDRPVYYEQLCEKELTAFANDLLQQHGILDKKASVLVTLNNDPNFTINKGALVVDLISGYLILIQREFYDNYTKEIMHAVICHEIGHILHNDYSMQCCVLAETYIPFLTLSTILGVIVGGTLATYVHRNKQGRTENSDSNFKKDSTRDIKYNLNTAGQSLLSGFLFWIAAPLIYNIAYARWLQKCELRADACSAKICGSLATKRMLDALADLAPRESGWLARFKNKLFAAHPPYEERIAALSAYE